MSGYRHNAFRNGSLCLQTNIYSRLCHKADGAYIKGQNTRPCPGTYKNGKGKSRYKGRKYCKSFRRQSYDDAGRTVNRSYVQPYAQRAYYGGKHLPDKKQCLFVWMFFCRGGSGYSALQGKSIGFDKRTRLRKAYKSPAGGRTGSRGNEHGYRLCPERTVIV